MPVVERVEDAEMPYLVTLAEKVESAGRKSFRQPGGVEEETHAGVEIQVKDGAKEEEREGGGETALSDDGVRDRYNPEGDCGDLNGRSEPNPFRFPVVLKEGGEEEDAEEDAHHDGQVEIPPKWVASEGAENTREITAQSGDRHSREVES